MKQEYKDLLFSIARNGAITAEKALDLFEKDSDDYKSSLEARDSFNEIEDAIKSGDRELTQIDYVKLYAAAIITRNLIQNNVNTWQLVLDKYDNQLIPTLKEIGISSDEDFVAIVEKFFG